MPSKAPGLVRRLTRCLQLWSAALDAAAAATQATVRLTLALTALVAAVAVLGRTVGAL